MFSPFSYSFWDQLNGCRNAKLTFPHVENYPSRLELIKITRLIRSMRTEIQNNSVNVMRRSASNKDDRQHMLKTKYIFFHYHSSGYVKTVGFWKPSQYFVSYCHSSVRESTNNFQMV